jgi:RNA polymerase sigma-70 factor, ECF subfamily
MLTISASSRQVTTRGVDESASIPAVSSDEALLSAIAAGDRPALQALYLRHKVRVYRFVLRLIGDAASAEDIVNEVFLDVWRQADGFKAKSRVSTWILAIARHKALTALRVRPEQRLDERAANVIADTADDAETRAEQQDRGMIVRRCLSLADAEGVCEGARCAGA